jgi:ABC-type branched-subunit amino acid transport system ATPase component
LKQEILRLENVCKRFGGIVVADNIALSLRSGLISGGAGDIDSNLNRKINDMRY